MPTKKKPAGTSDRDWLLASWEWAAEVSSGTGLVCRVSLMPTTRVGVWRVIHAAVDVVDGKAAGVRCKVEGEWPCAEAQSWAAFTYRQFLKLDTVLAQEFMGGPVDIEAPVY